MTVPLAVPPRAVLFDLDGTLIDSLPAIAEAIIESLRARGHEVAAQDVQDALGPPMLDVLGALVDVPDAEAEALFAHYTRIYEGRYAARARKLPGADVLLDALAAQGVALALITNNRERTAHVLLRALGWEHHFRVVVGYDSVPRFKPDPDPALHALAALELAPEAAALVGDSPLDMRCGHSAGLPAVVGVSFGHPAAALYEAGASHVCASLDEVAGLLLDPAYHVRSGAR